MKKSLTVIDIYEKIKVLYQPETKKLVDELLKGNITVQMANVMFPPNDASSFSSKQAETGFLKNDCAVITAFRQTYTYDENIKRNEKLCKDMNSHGLKYIRVDGCFREAKETEASHEESYFVYDNSHNGAEFFSKLYKLSEKYEQDSFLFKSAGMVRTAFLVSTNDVARKLYGDVSIAGQLYLDLPPVGPYTELINGRFTFLNENPNI